MVHGYHAIFGTYGFWLPNDPRGSWSEFVGKWELVRFGKSTRSLDRIQLSAAERQAQREAKKLLKYPEVALDGHQALAVANGFAEAVRKSNFTIWACSILPQHVHLVIARHDFSVEQIVNLMKGEATKQLQNQGLHPLAAFQTDKGRPPRPWADRKCKVFLDCEEAIDHSIRYVEQNAGKEGKPKQTWSFVRPFRGLDAGWVTYH